MGAETGYILNSQYFSNYITNETPDYQSRLFANHHENFNLYSYWATTTPETDTVIGNITIYTPIGLL